MNKAEKKFRSYAILVIFILLTVLLAIINGVNFTMASRDADEITKMIADRQGALEFNDGSREVPPSQTRKNDFRVGPMGPDSPETQASIRYFTFAFSKNGDTVDTVAYHISAVTEDDAREWASGLLSESTGWTRGTYRYRVYKNRGMTYVTVIDQGRELLPSYRILIISAVGEILCLAVGWFVLLAISRKIYAPIEEADRKQKLFIKSANKEFRLPLTIISGNTELSERTHGPDDHTRSTRRQLSKLNELVEQLGTISIFDDENTTTAEIPLSEFLIAALDREKDNFSSRGLSVTAEISPDITLSADPESMKRLIDELVSNALKYSLTKASFIMKRENGHILLETKNDASLPDGQADQVFDRFTTLENAKENENSAGLGLSYVKDIVRAQKGRVTAAVSGGTFTLRITI